MKRYARDIFRKVGICLRNIFELSSSDLKWLEDKFERYQQLDKEIAIRKEELKIKQTDENIGGGKSNAISSPVENQVVKELSDPYIVTRLTWKECIEQTFEESSEDVQAIIHAKYWGDQSYQSWTAIGDEHYISKTQVYRLRYDVLERFAKKIGYI